MHIPERVYGEFASLVRRKEERVVLRTPEAELLLDDDLNDNTPPSAWELGLSIDLTREDLDADDEEDGLGFRALYEQPELITRTWVGAH